MAYVTDRTEIEALVRREIGRLAKKDCMDLEEDINLIENLKMDSLYLLEMYALIENEFGVMIPTDRLQSMVTIRIIIDTVIEFQGEQL